MNYLLIKTTPDCNERGPRTEKVAISESKPMLETYCLQTYGVPAGEPEKFSWNSYYVIEETSITVVK
jgi:hypothetical protein